MYKKDMLRDWTSPHLLDYGWYLDYLKENTLPSKFEKHEPRFLQAFRTLEKETPSKKRLEWGKKRGKRQIQEFGLEMQDKEDVPIQSKRKAQLGLAMASFKEVPMTSTQTILAKVEDTILNIQEFHSP